MAELDDILKAYPYAETIDVTVANGALKVTLAEASLERNREFGRMALEISRETGIERLVDMDEDSEIMLFVTTLLKKWDLTIGGEKVPIADAFAILTRDNSGRLLFREMGRVCAQPELFLTDKSKKKPCSPTTPKASPSATKPKRSRPARKRPVSTSPKGSRLPRRASPLDGRLVSGLS